MPIKIDPIDRSTASVVGPILQHAFNDHEEFASAISGSIPIVRKLDRGPFAGFIQQVDLGEVRVLHVRIESLLEIEGCSAEGFQSFGIPAGGCTEARWCGQTVSGGKFVNSYDASGSFEAVIRPGFESFVVSVRKDWLRERGASLEISGEGTSRRARAIEYDAVSLRMLLGMLRTGFDSTPTTRNASWNAALRERLRFELPGRLLELSSGCRQETVRSRNRVLDRARAWIAEVHAEEHTVANLCRDVGVGERTVRRAFLEHYGVTPHDYLKARRLNRVHSELLRPNATALRVHAVANRWGFWHMGQLAADYRHLFDELPSETLARAR
jgi:AraC family ethanolamine operon transcriptional activator